MAHESVAHPKPSAYDSKERPQVRTPGIVMASLLFDNDSKHYFVRFHYGGRSFKRSLGTGKERLARAQKGRIEETLILLRHGRLTIPPNADPAAYILSDGRKLHDGESKLLTLAELTASFQAARIPGHKELSTVKTEDIHIRHLLRILKGSTLPYRRVYVGWISRPMS
jgi:hypothetical protein